MATDDRNCSSCYFWQTDDPIHTWAAPCDLGIIAKPEAWQSCAQFLDRERAKAEQAMQSECRPTTLYQMWQAAIQGGQIKP